MTVDADVVVVAQGSEGILSWSAWGLQAASQLVMQ